MVGLRFLSVCSGIEAASCAWLHLGFEAVAVSEIEPFPCAVLKQHYPDVPNWGDMTKFKEWPDADVDVLVGGTPCQSFSVAGLRKGLDDPRGNLMLTYLAIAAKYRPTWVVWENVPGARSGDSKDEYIVPMTLAIRGRGDSHDLEYRQDGIANAILTPNGGRAGIGVGAVAYSMITANTGSNGVGVGVGVAATLDQSGPCAVAFAQNSRDELRLQGGDGALCGSLAAEPGMKQTTYIAFNNRQDPDVSGDVTHPLGAKDNGMGMGMGMQVRRLTPKECERLQGFPDDYTGIPVRGKTAADGPRYKALGNSMARPVMEWIGNRIKVVASLTEEV